MSGRDEQSEVEGPPSEEPEHLFDQTNGVLGSATDDGAETDPEGAAARRARGAALGATGAAGWGR